MPSTKDALWYFALKREAADRGKDGVARSIRFLFLYALI
jgi:hypothetical protein